MSNKIECPNCHTAFTIDEAGYADIVRQVHGAEFDKALDERLEAAAREKQAVVVVKGWQEQLFVMASRVACQGRRVNFAISCMV